MSEANRIDALPPSDISKELLDLPLKLERLLGAHMPTAGGLKLSLIAGKKIGCTAVQLFTGSPRQWSHPPLKEADIRAFHEARTETGMAFTVAHDSYLINLAAPSSDVLERSRDAFRGELDRAEVLGIPWVVTHMGAHLDQGEDAAIDRLIESLKMILEETDTLGYSSGIALETTAGQGTGLGWRFEHIGRVLDGVGRHPRLGVCLDTCHIFVAGYDIRDETSYNATWAEFEKYIGIDQLKVIHANDAKKPLGSRVDRHEHIGEGEIGRDAFARLVMDPKLLHIPIILETPDSETMHPVNLQRLQRLASGGALGALVKVQCFGHYSDAFGAEIREYQISSGATVAELITQIEADFPKITGLAVRCRFGVNEEFAELNKVLEEGDFIAFIPPMSGG